MVHWRLLDDCFQDGFLYRVCIHDYFWDIHLMLKEDNALWSLVFIVNYPRTRFWRLVEDSRLSDFFMVVTMMSLLGLLLLGALLDLRVSSSIPSFEGEIVGLQSYTWRMIWRLGIFPKAWENIPLGFACNPCPTPIYSSVIFISRCG